MAITRQDFIRTFDPAGNLISDVPVTTDITAETVQSTLETQARSAYTANRTFLAIPAPTNAQVLAQTRALTKQMNAVIRLVAARDLLADETID